MKTYLLATLIGVIISLILFKIAIPILSKLNGFQPILKYVKEHEHKSKTPTFGGVIILISGLLTYLIFNRGNSRIVTVIIAVTISFFVVGFIDDFIKIRYKNNAGLTPIKKFLFQTSIAVIVAIFLVRSGVTSIYIPFTTIIVNIGILSAILNIFLFVATVNAVNLTDGLDGLCASVSTVYLIAISVIILLQISINKNAYVNVTEYENIALISLSFAGSLLGYLAYNVNKASVFMGDCGSLALGGLIASVSVFSLNTLYVAVLGITYVITTLSVIIQVVYFKLTKKRVFLMAPIHHHFQHKGYGEAKISYCYALVTAIISAVAIVCVCR